MQNLDVNGTVVLLNDKGHLANFADWSEEVAKVMARKDGLELSECHWLTIRFLREFYEEYEVPPSDRMLIKSIGDKISDYGCTKGTLNQIFPKGGCRHACRLAGLPDAYCHAC